MADIQLRQQFPAPADVSVGRDLADNDIWLRQQFPAPADLSHYRTILPLLNLPGGPFARSVALAVTEAPDVAAFTFTVTGGGVTLPFTLGATEPQDVAAFALNHGFPLTLGVTESPDVAAFSFTSPATATQGAGKGSGKKKRLAFVEIDGITYHVNSVHEAGELFEIAARKVSPVSANPKLPTVAVIGKPMYLR